MQKLRLNSLPGALTQKKCYQPLQVYTSFSGGMEILGIFKIGNTRKISSFRIFPIKQTTLVIEDDWENSIVLIKTKSEMATQCSLFHLVSI